MKRAHLAKLKGKKIDGGVVRAPAAGRPGPAALPDRRERRRLDQAQGLVPFAVKLDGELVKKLHTLAQQRGLALNEVVGELLATALDRSR